MKKIIIFFMCCIFSSCNFGGVKQLGNSFAIVESDVKYVFIQYCTDENCDVGILVIPSKVIEYNYDKDWIIAKTRDSESNISYWIVDKHINTLNSKKLYENIKLKTFGPLDSIVFHKIIELRRINLALKKSENHNSNTFF